MSQPATFSLSELFDSAYDGIFVLDADRRFVMFNQACERLTGRSAKEIIGTTCDCSDVDRRPDQQSGSLAASLCPGLDVFQGDASTPPRRIHIEQGTGERRLLETNYVTVRDAEGRPRCVIGVVREGDSSTAEEPAQVTPLDERLADIERRAILTAIRRAGGRRNLAARLMGISRSRLYRRLEALGINPDGEPAGAQRSAGNTQQSTVSKLQSAPLSDDPGSA